MYRLANNDFAVALAVTVCRIDEINAAIACKSYQAKAPAVMKALKKMT